MSEHVVFPENVPQESTPATPVQSSARRTWGDAEFAYALAIVFGALLLVGLLRHEMWRDELQGWLLARDSASLSELISRTSREGHPALWHIVLFGLARITPDPVALQFFQWFVVTAAIYIVARFSPFTRLQKVLFAFGYFPLFEYGMLSRSYSLGALFLVGFLALWTSQKKRVFLQAVLLLLLANTSLFGFLIALVFGVFLLFELVLPIPMGKPRWPWDTVVCMLVLFAAVAVVCWQIASRGAFFTIERTLMNPQPWMAKLGVLVIWQSYLPLPDMTQLRFWGTDWLLSNPRDFVTGSFHPHFYLVPIAVCIAVGYCVLLFFHRPRVLFFYLAATVLVILTMIVSRGTITAPRHYGHLFLVLFAALWLFESQRKHSLKEESLVPAGRLKALRHSLLQSRSTIILSLLTVHAVAGGFAWSMDLRYPFSSSRLAADVIKEKGLSHALLAGGKAAAVSPLSAFLNREIFFLEQNRYGTFINRHRRAGWNRRDARWALRNLRKLVRAESGETAILLVLNKKLRFGGRNAQETPPLWQSPPSIVRDEEYFMYYIPRRVQ